MQKSMMKYITRMGQNTGTLKASKNVQIIAMMMPFVAECLPTQKKKTLVRTVGAYFQLVHSQPPVALLTRPYWKNKITGQCKTFNLEISRHYEIT